MKEELIPSNFTDENDPWIKVRKNDRTGWGVVGWMWRHAVGHLVRHVYIEQDKADPGIWRFGCLKCNKHWMFARKV